jgi:hypothetical protein
MWSITNLRTNRLVGSNKVLFGVQTADTVFDNYELYDLRNKPPMWDRIPPLQAVEDVPFIYNFSSNVSDPDTPLGQLRVSTSSPYVTDINGLAVTFEFPNGITQAVVPLVLHDQTAQAIGVVNFTILPVNDPPSHDMKTEHLATEDVPLTIDFSIHVWDVDNETEDLIIRLDDQYATIEGLNLTVTFPEGILKYDIWLNLTDGLLDTPIHLNFTIKPVDDPPSISTLGEFTAIEDQTSVFNITQFLFDIDTPVRELAVIVGNPNCTVIGQELHFRYSLGGFNEIVLVQVTDGRNLVDANLSVIVEERNDAPIIHIISPRLFTEDEAKTVDLSPYIDDEDTPLEELNINSDHPAIVEVTDFNITLLFTQWEPEHEVNFTVSDGFLITMGSFLVQVKEVNDLPEIIGLGELLPPIVILIDEGGELWFDVLVSDEDNMIFEYSVDTSWDGLVVFANGSLRVIAEKDDINEYRATIEVDDGNGGTASLDISVEVKNVNDPPTLPIIHKPNNHTVVEERTNVTFAVEVNDPDLWLGQSLTIQWISNISGVIKALTSDDTLEFITDALPVGEHRITIKVSDGEYEREVWMELTVLEKYVPPPEKEEPFFTEPTGIASILLILLVVIVLVAWMATKGRKDEREEIETDITMSEQVTVEIDEPVQDLAGLSEELDRLATGLEAQRDAEQAISPPELEPVQETITIPEQVAPLSDEEIAARAHAGEVRDVMNALTQLPRGLPTALWDKDMAKLAKEIVDGPKRTTSDGTLLVEIEGNWFTADHTKIGSFLREWKEESVAAVSISDEERGKMLTQLEQRLAEGKLSEETYERLRKKYESQ